ncbi:MAG TPA: HDOD domain-containing protein [bacterium]|nr:HDOD domain-containing protein [bacterium]
MKPDGRRMGAEEFIDGIAALPSPPAMLQDVLHAADHGTFNQIARLVERDLGLAARVLRIANSAFYGAGDRISNVPMALGRLGTRELKGVILSSLMVDTFKGLRDALDLESFWRHSFASGIASRLLSSPSQLDADQLSLGDNPFYMAGLLHHVGILAEALQDPAGFARARAVAAAQGHSLAEAEACVFGFDHAEAGAVLLERWRFPEETSDAARYHLRPDEAVRNLETVRVVHLSAMLCHELGPVDSYEGVAPWFSERAFYELGWTQAQLPALVEKLKATITRAGQFSDAVLCR